MNQDDLIGYVGRVHGRTFEVARLLTDDLLGWRPRPNEFTAAEIALHIANARLMTAGAIHGEGLHYAGHDLAAGRDHAWLLQTLLRSSKKTIARLAAADFESLVTNASGSQVPVWSMVLGGLIEHEVHHRSQLCEYLGLAGIAPPPLYGLHAEDVPR
ncbi:MAG: DinB family protein [Tepidiformaceae bacterium]